MITINKKSLLDNLSSHVREAVTELVYLFLSCDQEIYLVGGCVRDLLLNKSPNDLDLCTSATVDEMKDAVTGTEFRVYDSGIKHGTLTISLDDVNFEVTTFRSDIGSADHRHPDTIIASTLEEDLKRRDFTINSFVYDIMSENLMLLDESYLDDLSTGIIRCVSDPNIRFQEDALRMLRAIRFSSQLGFTIDSNTFRAIKDNANLLTYVSKERIRDELTKILLSDYPERIEFIELAGLDEYIGLGIKDMKEEVQYNKYHYTDVFHHTVDVVRNVPKEFNLRWAAFFHDVGKVYTRSVDKEGYYHYNNHNLSSCDYASKFMDLYKFSNNQKEVISTLILNHDTNLTIVVFIKQMARCIGVDNLRSLISLMEADRYAHRLYTSEFSIDVMSKVKENYKYLITSKEPYLLKDLAINGNDLISLGIDNKNIGLVLNACLDHIIDIPEDNNKDFLINFVKLNYIDK